MATRSSSRTIAPALCSSWGHARWTRPRSSNSAAATIRNISTPIPRPAKRSIWGGLVASGWHTVAMFMRLLVDGHLKDSDSIGSPGVDEVRWLKPVRPGDRLRRGPRRRRRMLSESFRCRSTRRRMNMAAVCPHSPPRPPQMRAFAAAGWVWNVRIVAAAEGTRPRPPHVSPARTQRRGSARRRSALQ